MTRDPASWPPSAATIKQALATHHSRDVFVDECKNGPSWTTTGLAQMDAWVLCRTWTPLTTVGYEIKVGRQDFERDQKWTRYLDLCHAFYFVSPAGLIKAADLPKGIGLKWYSKAGNIHTKLRADRWQPDPDKLNLLLLYVIMCRSKIVKDPGAEQPDHLRAIREIVENAGQRKELASIVSGHVRKVYEGAQQESREAKNMVEAARRFAAQLAILGITWDPEKNDWAHCHQIEQQIAELYRGLDRWELSHMNNLGRQMVEFSDRLSRLQEQLRAEVTVGAADDRG